MAKKLVDDALWEVVQPLSPTSPATSKWTWAAAPFRSCGLDRHLIRLEERHPLGDAPTGNGVRQWDDMPLVGCVSGTKLACGKTYTTCC